jgi:hypothetical protein
MNSLLRNPMTITLIFALKTIEHQYHERKNKLFQMYYIIYIYMHGKGSSFQREKSNFANSILRNIYVNEYEKQ